MAGKSAGFGVNISVVDNATATLEKVNKRIAALSAPAERFARSAAKFGDVSGINRLAEGFHVLGARSLDTFRSLDRIMPALSAITGAASIAGMSTMVQKWSQLGQQTQNFANRIGAPVSHLTALRGAARLAGVSAQQLDSGLSALDQHLRDATFSRDSTAIQQFEQLHVAYKKAGGGAREADEAFYDVAESIRKLNTHGARLQAANALGMGDLLPFLEKGAAGIRELEGSAKKAGVVMDDGMVSRFASLAQSIEKTTESAEGLGLAIANKLEPKIKPLVDSVGDWLDKNRGLIATDVDKFITTIATDIPNVVREAKTLTEQVDKIAKAMGGWKTVAEGLVAVKVASWASDVATALGPLAWLLKPKSVPGAAPAAAIGLGAYLGFRGAEASAEDIANMGAAGFRPRQIDDFGNAIGFVFDPSSAVLRDWAEMDRPRGRLLDAARGARQGGSLPSIAPDIDAEVRRQARALGLDDEHMSRLARMEQGAHSAISPAGAIGPMQLMPRTARDLNVDPYDWHQNVEGGVRYYRGLLDQFHDYAAADAAYNAGPGNAGVRRFAATGDMSALPAETQNYVNRIDGSDAEVRRVAATGDGPPVSRVDGRVQVDVTLNNAPPGTRVTAQSSGSASASPPKVVTPMHGY